MNQSQLLKYGEEFLKEKNIDDVNIKAKMLLQFILKQSREELIINAQEEVNNYQEQEYKKSLKQMTEGRPLQYITNNQEFMGLNFYVDENVLIPQPDTEILVEEAIKTIKNINQSSLYDEIAEKVKGNITSNQKQINVLDLCTGSGAIAVSIAKYMKEEEAKRKIPSEEKELENNEEDISLKKINVFASDISSKALNVAKQNAIKNDVEEKIEFIESDMFLNLTDKCFDIIVSNPPYIETKVISNLSKEVQQEPILALDGGEDGLKFYKIILENAANYLNKDGYVLFEIGYDQGKKILDLLEKLKKENKCELELITKTPIKDFEGNDRVMILKKKVN